MSDIAQNKQDKKEMESNSPAASIGETPLDTRLLSDAITELNISRKNIGIYPPGHIQITRSIDRAYERLTRMLQTSAEMTIGVAKDVLLVGREYFDQKNPIYREFAISLNAQGIAAITFLQGMEKDELVRFHRILTTNPKDITAKGGIGKAVGESGISHIRIQAIDYSSFHLTEEDEISQPALSRSNKSGAAVWQDFVSNLIEGKAALLGNGISRFDAAAIDPVELAKFMNERKLDSGAALKSYDQMVADYVGKTAAKNVPGEDDSATLEKMNVLIQELHPELRKQFLSTAFRHLASSSAQSVMAAVLGGYTEDMVIEMLHQVSEEGRQMSPTLSGLMQKMSKVKQGGAARTSHDAAKSEGLELPELSLDHMKKLFGRESYEQYVDENYDAVLKRLTAEAAEGRVDQVIGFSVEAYDKTLEEKHLAFQIARALLAFMEEEVEPEDYREFSQKLGTMIPDFLAMGNFPMLLDIMETLRAHAQTKPSGEIRALAQEALGMFSAPDFITHAVDAFDAWSENTGSEASVFLKALGPKTIPVLMDIYAGDDTPEGRIAVFDLLVGFGEATVEEAQKRLQDPRQNYVRNLLVLLRRIGSPVAWPYIKPILQHKDKKVRMDMLVALLRYKDSGAVLLLRELLHSSDAEIVEQTLELVGLHHLTSVVEDLLGMMKTGILFPSHFILNEQIIRALGRMGDVRALHSLEKLARISWSLYPRRLSRMKTVLYEALEQYPKKSITGLLHLGEQSKDENIRLICKNLRDRT